MKAFLQRIVGRAVWDFASWCRDRFGLFAALRALFRSGFSAELVSLPNPLTGGQVFIRPGCNAALDHALRDYEYFRQDYGENIVFFELRKRVRLALRGSYVQKSEYPAVAADVSSAQTRRF